MLPHQVRTFKLIIQWDAEPPFDLDALCDSVRAAGAAVHRTDRAGAVTVTTDGRRIEVHSHLENTPGKNPPWSPGGTALP